MSDVVRYNAVALLVVFSALAVRETISNSPFLEQRSLFEHGT